MKDTHSFTGAFREIGPTLYIQVPRNDAKLIRKKLHGNVAGEPVEVEVAL